MASFAAVAIMYAAGVESEVEDTLLGALLTGVMAAGFLGSVAAFGAAIVAWLRRERWTFLWLPVCLFPALVVFLMLGEAVWWE